MLEELGYRVLATRESSEAVRLTETHVEKIDLLMTDVVMPEMNGRELSERIVVIEPTIKCLFMSGYTSNVIAHQGVLDEGVSFIQKPFSLQALSSKVREALYKEG
jgi:DNA-binding NtrC family response regulator